MENSKATKKKTHREEVGAVSRIMGLPVCAILVAPVMAYMCGFYDDFDTTLSFIYFLFKKGGVCTV